jgi:hypothetical protein
VAAGTDHPGGWAWSAAMGAADAAQRRSAVERRPRHYPPCRAPPCCSGMPPLIEAAGEAPPLGSSAPPAALERPTRCAQLPSLLRGMNTFKELHWHGYEPPSCGSPSVP